jgi:hypothetical protein
MNDSTTVESLSNIINDAIIIGQNMTGNNPLIPHVPDSLLSAVLTLIGTLIIRRLEKRKLKKRYESKDK